MSAGAPPQPHQRVSRTHPCPVCRKPDWCLFTADGEFICCQRSDTWRGEPAIRRTDAGWLFSLADREDGAFDAGLEGLAKRERPRHDEVGRPAGLSRLVLDAVYRQLAALCGLRQPALDDLIEKRRFREALDTGLYFSLPRSRKQNRRITAALIARFGCEVIAAVPGFTERWGELAFRSARGQREDYAVMGLDEDGLAFWGYSRRLPFDPDHDDAKYMLLSSSRAGEASLSGLPKYHVAGRRFAKERVGITEGVIKAEIASARLGFPVIGLYSTSVDAATLAEVTRLIETWSPSEVLVAFDADKHELNAEGKPVRPAVLAGERKLIEAFTPLVDVYSAEWNITNGKGIDDLLTAGGTYRRQSRYVPPQPRPRVPQLCAEPGVVDGDTELDTVVARTHELTRERLGRRAAGTVVLVGAPPGSGKTGSGLRAQEEAPVNVFWAVSRHEQADELVQRSRDEPCACGQRRINCRRHALTLNHDYGRNEENCTNIDVIHAAQAAGYGARVGGAVCGTAKDPICPARLGCAYHAQFERSGSHVAPVEVLVNRPTSTAHTAAVFLDDIDSGRLIERTRVTRHTLERAAQARGAPALRPLLVILERALGAATTEGAYHADAYDLLDHAAREGGSTLEAVLAGHPTAMVSAPEPTVAAYESAAPGQFVELVELLHEEFPLWRDRKAFTSGLRIHAGGIDVARLNRPAERRNGDTPFTNKAVSVFSSTPDPVLRQWVARLGLEVQAEYRPQVALPSSVRVIQDAGGFYGKGTTESNDNDALFARARAYLEELRPSRPAVVTHMHLRNRASLELGVPIERVLYFGNVRGSNAVRDADALLVIGTPGMSPSDAYWTACAAFRGEGAPPSPRQVMRPLPYGGWRDAHGRGRESRC